VRHGRRGGGSARRCTVPRRLPRCCRRRRQRGAGTLARRQPGRPDLAGRRGRPAAGCAAQPLGDPVNTPTTRYLVVLMRRTGFDERLVAPHIAFLDELRADGLLELNGGFSDRSGGAYLLRGIASLEEAEAIVARDPLAVHGASDIVVHEWLAR